LDFNRICSNDASDGIWTPRCWHANGKGSDPKWIAAESGDSESDSPETQRPIQPD
jgi:hypothetical protein